ncbi:MAG: hypothetical protein R2864_04885 [Syntrophotaleaceae bacterium]
MLALGVTVYCGIDYQKILRQAEGEGDFIVWDGGNNDTPFFKPGLHLVVLDPLRAGDEVAYYPGLVNLLCADMLVVNKVDEATAEQLAVVHHNVRQYNSAAAVAYGVLEVTVENPKRLQGKRLLVIEDGPTVTHGGMAYGAGWLLHGVTARQKSLTPVRWCAAVCVTSTGIGHTWARYCRLWATVRNNSKICA